MLHIIYTFICLFLTVWCSSVWSSWRVYMCYAFITYIAIPCNNAGHVFFPIMNAIWLDFDTHPRRTVLVIKTIPITVIDSRGMLCEIRLRNVWGIAESYANLVEITFIILQLRMLRWNSAVLSMALMADLGADIGCRLAFYCVGSTQMRPPIHPPKVLVLFIFFIY